MKKENLKMIEGGYIKPAESEKVLFRGILKVFFDFGKRSLPQGAITKKIQEMGIAKTKTTIELGLYKLGMARFFKVKQVRRARIWFMLKMAKSHQERLFGVKSQPQKANESTHQTEKNEK